MRASPFLISFLFLALHLCYSAALFHDIICNFEKEEDCIWQWNKTISNGFRLLTGEEVEKYLKTSPEQDAEDYADASNNITGHYLFAEMPQDGPRIHVWSPEFLKSLTHCRLHIDFKMVNMSTADFQVVIEIPNTVAWVADEKLGNDDNAWSTYVFLVGGIRQPFRILFEVTPSPFFPTRLSMDNIKLINCFPEDRTFKTCPPKLFRCSDKGKDYCLNKTQICDIQVDCLSGADENQGCEKVPKYARCTFEDDLCGWKNIPSAGIKWSRYTGDITTLSYYAPVADHTYRNESGKYLFVNMTKGSKLGSATVLESPLFNPPPKYHARPDSPYYESCLIRFFFHQFGPYTGSLALFLCEVDAYGERSVMLWFSYGDKGDGWQRETIVLPKNITNKYYLQFEARRGFIVRGSMAIDDISLSPECFGLNVPEKEKEGYDYNSFKGFVEPTVPVETHRDFINKTVYKFTTCGARGRIGPTPYNCSVAYNNTNVNVTVLEEVTLNGVQKWPVPHAGFYTIIVKGAGGGKGYDGLGFSKGSVVVGVYELNETQSLYILVGHEGGNACRKDFAVIQNHSCWDAVNEFNSDDDTDSNSTTINPLLELKKIEVLDTGGGGGGGSYVFLWTNSGRVPIIVSGGGGGLGGGSIADDGSQHGKGIDVNRPSITGSESGKYSAGAGGGWTQGNNSLNRITGRSFVQGGFGGIACWKNSNVHGAGGFGGGGGGCLTGGGGGGYAGGAASLSRKNGQGGFSFASPKLIIREVYAGTNIGDGSVIVIPAIKGCGCEYLCVAMDEYQEDVRCICPTDSILQNDGVSCHYTESFRRQVFEKILYGTVGMMSSFVICLLTYLTYDCIKKIKKIRIRNKRMTETEIQLSRLRTARDNLITEFSTTYEFGGGTFSIRDLNELPRENLKLVKSLGQGAFGEVYQGLFRTRRGRRNQVAVAVKTLPETSNTQAEADFAMEALIMSKFYHPNIVRFIGVCFKGHPRFIVLELLAGGDLKNFLRESRPKQNVPCALNYKDLLMCVIDVAKACCYLEQYRFIHRDIAARNCLLTTKRPDRVVKIADFGMARDIYRSDYYRKCGRAMLPIKWMPPEAYQNGLFTTKTDVWSFGILMWEVMSLGHMPYTGCGNREVMRLIIDGKRLEPPVNCPPPIYAIMEKCWCAKPEDRPSFRLILERLGYCMQDPEVLNAPMPTFSRIPPLRREATIVRPEHVDRFFQMDNIEYYLSPKRRNRGGTTDLESQPGGSTDLESQPGGSTDLESQPGPSTSLPSLPARNMKLASRRPRSTNPPSLPARSTKLASRTGRSTNPPSLPARSTNLASRPGRTINLASRPGRTINLASRPGRSINLASRPGRSTDLASRPGDTINLTSQPGGSRDPDPVGICETSFIVPQPKSKAKSKRPPLKKRKKACPPSRAEQTQKLLKPKERGSLTRTLSLDAGALASQSVPYANVKVRAMIHRPADDSDSMFSVSRDLIDKKDTTC